MLLRKWLAGFGLLVVILVGCASLFLPLDELFDRYGGAILGLCLILLGIESVLLFLDKIGGVK